jgi:hypothetical protein
MFCLISFRDHGVRESLDVPLLYVTHTKPSLFKTIFHSTVILTWGIYKITLPHIPKK